MYITVEENPNCDAVEGRVFNEREKNPRSILQVRQTRQGRDVWCDITGLDADGKPCPALARKVDDSGDGTCYLVQGGAWGLRLKEVSQPGPWSLEDRRQWGESFLLLPSDGEDVKFAG